MGDKIIMSRKEFNRINILNKVLQGTFQQTDAANLLKLSSRHVNRIIQEARSSSLANALTHKSRGKASNKRIKDSFKNVIVDLYIKNYSDFKPTFFCEKLNEIHNIKTNKETVRKILIEHELWISNKKKHRKLHTWRERKHHIGELIQLDGSHEYWLENRYNKPFCLMASIDDASSTVFMRFYEYEGTFPVLDFMQRFIKKFGIPHALYLDKHSTYTTSRNPNLEEQLKNSYPTTQFQRVMHSLDIDTISAHSPQAKGRIERSFGTLQDRLIKELRLANISSIDDANNFLEFYLPKYNSKFSVKPKSNTSLFKSVPENFDYKWTFSIQDKRTILNDYTIQWHNRLFLINKPSLAQKKQPVFLQQALDGSLRFLYKNHFIDVKEITNKNVKLVTANKKLHKKLINLASKNINKNIIMDKIYLNNFSAFNP